MGAERHVRDESAPGGTPEDEVRLVRLESGMRWRVSVVARLISEEVAAGRERARLVVQLDCLSAPRRPLRAAIPGARSLGNVAEATLRELLMVRRGSARAARNSRR